MSQAEFIKRETNVVSQKWKPEFDNSRAWRTRLGFLLISNDTIMEEDVFRMTPEGVGVHFTRAPMPTGCTVENLASMEQGLAASAAELLPEFDLSVVCYGCTSGTVVIGEEAVERELKRPIPNRQATTLLRGVIEGLHALSAKKIVMGTPYTDDVNTLEKQYMENNGFELLNVQGLNLTYDADITRVTPAFLKKFAQAIDHPEADAIFLSCGAFRAVDVLDEIEQATGKPVVSSNQGMMWHCLRLAGIEDRINGFGRLLSHH